MKKIIFYFVALIFLNCAPAIKITDFKPKNETTYLKEPDSVFIPKPRRLETAYKGFKYPYIHKNGFNTYKIELSKIIKSGDSKYANELKFFNTYSSYYTRQSMFEKFGNWNKNIHIRGKIKPFLVWEKVKLFPKKDNYFYVIAGGYECTTCKSDNDRIYSSVIILDENKQDCLSNKDPDLKKELLKFFSEGIKNLTNSNKFYTQFH